jgi:endonuclease/exonuclease/phosphatase family metal-dependent hydrolase
MKTCAALPTRLPAALPIALAAGLATTAAAQVRLVSWNISNYNGTDRQTQIQTAVYGVVPSGALAGQSMSPMVIGTQEFSSATAVNNFRTLLNTASGSPGDWSSATFFNGNDSDNGFFYRNTRFTLVGARVIAVGGASPNQPRDTTRYDLRPVGYTAPGSTLAVYVSHFKAQDSGTSVDETQRLTEAQRIRDNAEGINTNGAGSGLPAGWNFVVLGDFNVQTSSEGFYQELVGSQVNNTGRVFDPINTPASWNNNSTYRFVHTQDPGTAVGGMDDRHDQILISSSLRDSVGWHYIGSNVLAFSTSTWNDPNHSYRVWGNDGSSYNTSLNVTTNAMVGNTIATAVRDCVGTSNSGHLPVLADFRVPAKAGVSSVTLNFGTVTQGSPTPTLVLTVSNTGDTALFGSNGVAALNYSLSPAPGFTVPGGSFVDAAGGAGVNHNILMPTATLGPKNSTLIVTTDSPENPTISVTLTGNVVPANQIPNANAGADQTVTDFDNDGFESITLDGSLSTDDGTITQYRWIRLGSDIAPPSASPTLLASLPVGAHTVTLEVTDNLGAIDTDTLLVTINPWPGCNDIDFNNDTIFPDTQDVVDFIDAFAGSPCPACDPLDFNNDGVFPDNADITTFLGVFAGSSC